MDLNSGSDFRASKTNTEVLITELVKTQGTNTDVLNTGLVKTPGLTTRY
jgi:hypothetical protein